MEKKNKITLIITTMICIGTYLIYIVFRNNFGKGILDFDGMNQENILVTWKWALCSILLNIILNFGLSLEICKERGAKYLVKLGKWIMPITDTLYYSVALYCSLKSVKISINIITCIFIGTIFIISGNYFPKNRINPYIGMKFPWLLSDKESWRKTHKVAAYTWIFAGILMIIYPFTEKRVFVILLIVILVGVIPLVYSLILVRRKFKEDLK